MIPLIWLEVWILDNQDFTKTNYSRQYFTTIFDMEALYLSKDCMRFFIDSLFILATALISFKMSLLTAGAWLTQRLWGYWRESESLNFKLYFSELTLSLLTGASAWLCMVYLSTFQIVFVQISNCICPN